MSDCFHTWKSPWLTAETVPVGVSGTLMLEVNGVQGFLTAGDIGYLCTLARTLPQGGNYLEVGSFMGLSACLVATSILSSGNSAARVFCVDTWEGSPDHGDIQAVQQETLFDVFSANVRKAGVDRIVLPFCGQSVDVAKVFSPGILDIIFIDANHSYEMCLLDIETWFPKLKPCGRMLGHDAVEDGGVRAAVDEFCRKRGLSFSLTVPPAAHFIWEISSR